MITLLPTARLLPLLVLFALITMGVRGYDVYSGLQYGSTLQAQEPTPAAPAATPAASPAPTPAPTPAPMPAPAPATAPTPAPEPVAASAPESAPVVEPQSEPEALPESFTASEIEVLQSLSKRRAELDARAIELDQRQALLNAAEVTTTQKIKELEEVKAEIQGLIRTVDEQQSSRVQSMVKMYETMKPREAAAILEQLDMGVTLDILERMKEGKSAAVLASMDPGRAGAITVEMSKRRDLPAVPE